MSTDHDKREATIRALTRYYLGGDRQVVGAIEPEHVREHYLRVLGYLDIVGAETASHAEIDLSRAGVVGIKLWIRDRATLNRLRSAGILGPPFHGHAFDRSGDADDDWDVLARMTLREPGLQTTRPQRLDAREVAEALAVFYLTRRGGGRLSPLAAAELIAPEQDDPEQWARQKRRTIAAIQKRLGPLLPEGGGQLTTV